MAATANPAIEAFVGSIGPAKVWGEVLIQANGPLFELIHIADREVPRDRLKRISISELRRLAMFTSSGQFRPLHASPDLQRGWLLICEGTPELWRALQELYPGSLPDRFAAESGAKTTDYREFTNRQSGMYRITQLLTDEQAANVTRAACHARFCLKQRLWTAPGLPADLAAEKSDIVCLEPCAVLLELARKATRIEQEKKVQVHLSRSELESFIVAAEAAIASSASGASGERVANVASPSNPRRLQLLIEKFKQEISGKADEEE